MGVRETPPVERVLLNIQDVGENSTATGRVGHSMTFYVNPS